MEAYSQHNIRVTTTYIVGVLPYISISSLQGYTELTVLPLTNTGKLWRLPLNCCCRQCRILRVTVNSSHNANYSYSDPALCICPPDTKK